VAHIFIKANKRANAVPLFSELTSHKSFITPAPTLSNGPVKIPDRDLATAIVAKVLADPPTIVKMRDKGIVTRYTILRPKTSQAAIPTRAPIPRP
jgi:hypothetical protein